MLILPPEKIDWLVHPKKMADILWDTCSLVFLWWEDSSSFSCSSFLSINSFVVSYQKKKKILWDTGPLVLITLADLMTEGWNLGSKSQQVSVIFLRHKWGRLLAWVWGKILEKVGKISAIG